MEFVCQNGGRRGTCARGCRSVGRSVSVVVGVGVTIALGLHAAISRGSRGSSA